VLLQQQLVAITTLQQPRMLLALGVLAAAPWSTLAVMLRPPDHAVPRHQGASCPLVTAWRRDAHSAAAAAHLCAAGVLSSRRPVRTCPPGLMTLSACGARGCAQNMSSSTSVTVIPAWPRAASAVVASAAAAAQDPHLVLQRRHHPPHGFHVTRPSLMSGWSACTHVIWTGAAGVKLCTSGSVRPRQMLSWMAVHLLPQSIGAQSCWHRCGTSIGGEVVTAVEMCSSKLAGACLTSCCAGWCYVLVLYILARLWLASPSPRPLAPS
jgi:hypothetical protein